MNFSIDLRVILWNLLNRLHICKALTSKYIRLQLSTFLWLFLFQSLISLSQIFFFIYLSKLCGFFFVLLKFLFRLLFLRFKYYMIDLLAIFLWKNFFDIRLFFLLLIFLINLSFEWLKLLRNKSDFLIHSFVFLWFMAFWVCFLWLDNTLTALDGLSWRYLKINLFTTN